MTCKPSIRPLVTELAGALLPPERIALSKWEKSWIIVKRRISSAPVSA